jgi:DNA-binding Lrp family transcriptional regulator
MDETDARLVRALQSDGRATAEELGARLNLSPSQAARRRARLERDGTVAGYRATVTPEAVGLSVQAMIQIEMAVHAPDAAATLSRRLRDLPEIVNVWTLTGEADYLVQAYCRDLAALNRLVHDVLLPHPTIAKVRSQIVLAHPKRDAPLPVG